MHVVETAPQRDGQWLSILETPLDGPTEAAAAEYPGWRFLLFTEAGLWYAVKAPRDVPVDALLLDTSRRIVSGRLHEVVEKIRALEARP